MSASGYVALNEIQNLKATELQEEHMLRELPNGIKDELVVKPEGGHELLKNVGRVILNGGQAWVNLNSTRPNTYRMAVNNFVDLFNVLTSPSVLAFASAKETNDDAPYELSYGSNLIDMGTYDERAIGLWTAGELMIRVEKSKVDSMPGSTTSEKFKNYLNQYPVELFYQLDTPQTVQLPTIVSPNTHEILRLQGLVRALVSKVEQLDEQLEGVSEYTAFIDEIKTHEGDEW